jgi:Cytochrome c7 and related cytochrome c
MAGYFRFRARRVRRTPLWEAHLAAIFGPRANLFMNAALIGTAVLLAMLIALVWVVPVMGFNTELGHAPRQPVPFSHEHHVGGLGLDCRYCHTSVEIAADAGMPATETCMTCHSQIWTNAALLAPVRQSLADNRPLRWTRVYTLPDYVYFDHSIHIAKGIGCTECHGPVGDMALTRKAASLTMRWCLDCHRDPAPHLRPKEAVFDPRWRRTAETPDGAALIAANRVHAAGLTDCGVCHR